MSRTKYYWTKCHGQNVVDKMSWSNCRGQNVMVKMSRSKYRGQIVVVKFSRTVLGGEWFAWLRFVILYPSLQADTLHTVVSDYINRDPVAYNYVLGMTLNSSVIVRGMTVKLRPGLRFRARGWGCEMGSPLQERMWIIWWHGSHFWVCITFCKMRHGDSFTEPDY